MSFLVKGRLTGIYKRDDKLFDGKSIQGGQYLQIAISQTMGNGDQKTEIVDFKTEKRSLYESFINEIVTLAIQTGSTDNGILWHKVLDNDNSLLLVHQRSDKTKSAA